MDLDQVQAFLTLSEELHFGRTADRMYRSQPRISRMIASLETEIGAALFERTSRRVSLTPLGAQLEARLRPAYTELLAARDAARRAARGAAGQLRVAFTSTTEGPGLTRLIGTFATRQPGCEVVPVEVSMLDPYGALRRGEADVLYNWLVGEQPGLTTGPVLEYQDRVLAVGRDDPLAELDAISVDQLAGRAFPRVPDTFPRAVLDAFYPSRTRSGHPMPRAHLARTHVEALALVARGLVVHPTVTLVASKLVRDDIALVPITDLPPLPLGLMWCTARENARIRALAQTAADLADRASRDLRADSPSASEYPGQRRDRGQRS
jgi:DNA-binding transcriptional LysR family regulator